MSRTFNSVKEKERERVLSQCCLFNRKFLYICIIFDNQNDRQESARNNDRQTAEIREVCNRGWNFSCHRDFFHFHGNFRRFTWYRARWYFSYRSRIYFYNINRHGNDRQKLFHSANSFYYLLLFSPYLVPRNCVCVSFDASMKNRSSNIVETWSRQLKMNQRDIPSMKTSSSAWLIKICDIQLGVGIYRQCCFIEYVNCLIFRWIRAWSSRWIIPVLTSSMNRLIWEICLVSWISY